MIGQDHALEAIAKSIRLSRSGLRYHDRPMGVFLFVGRSGTGKTEAAKALSEIVFNAPDSMTRVDMNEYTERIAVSRLVGAPPGIIIPYQHPVSTSRIIISYHLPVSRIIIPYYHLISSSRIISRIIISQGM